MDQAIGALGSAYGIVSILAYILGGAGGVAMAVMFVAAYHREGRLMQYAWPYLAMLITFLLAMGLTWVTLLTNWLDPLGVLALVACMLIAQIAIVIITGVWTHRAQDPQPSK